MGGGGGGGGGGVSQTAKVITKRRGGGVWGPPTEKIEISGFEKCILVDPRDGFAMDNGE